MTVIDNRKEKSYVNLTIKQAALLVGVTVQTMYRWRDCRKVERYNHWVVYFDEVR